MKSAVWVLLLSIAAAPPAGAQAARPLPADVNAQSHSRLPLILKDTLDEEGRRIFEAINGKDGNSPRLGPPASSMYSLAAAEPYDRLNQLLLNTNVIGPQFFEISTLVPAREFNGGRGVATGVTSATPSWKSCAGAGCSESFEVGS